MKNHKFVAYVDAENEPVGLNGKRKVKIIENNNIISPSFLMSLKSFISGRKTIK